MILYFDEYNEYLQQQHTEKTAEVDKNILKSFLKNEKYLHELNPEELYNYVNRYGIKGVKRYKNSILKYLKWLYKNHRIPTVELSYEFSKKVEEHGGDYIGFLDLTEFKKILEEYIQKINQENENADFNNLKAIYFLEWYGLKSSMILKVKTEDVSDDGTQVYISDWDKEIYIDDIMIANFFAEYKKQTGLNYKSSSGKDFFLPYHNMEYFIKTANRRKTTITIETIHNIRGRFFKLVGCDERFAKKNIYYSGRYCELLKYEIKTGIEYKIDDKTAEIINKVFSFDKPIIKTSIFKILADYNKFKEAVNKKMLKD